MSKCIRVVLDGRYIQDHFPGIGRYTYHLAEALGMLPDVQVELLVNPALPNTRYNLQALDGHVTLRPCPVPTFSIKEQTQLPNYVKALRPDVYHSPYYVKPLIKSWIRPVPSVLTMHDVLPLRVPGALGSRRLEILFRLTAALGLYSADRIIAVSEASREDILNLFHIPSKRINVVYEAASPAYHPYIPGDPRIAAVRKRYGLPEKFALYVGINKPHKNLVRLVQAWGKLGSGAQGWELVLAGGEDPRYKQARHEAARLGLPVHFPGSIAEEDLPALYNAAGIFVLPSTYEGFGLPVLEAMACGTPVLCSNTSSLPEIAGNAALYISPEDTDGIAEVLRCLIGDALLRAELSEKGRRQASRFSWERAARETLAVYRFALL